MNELNTSTFNPKREDSTHDFILRNISGSSRIISEVSLNLVNPSIKSLAGSSSKIQFNCDRKHYTPSFIILSEQSELEANSDVFKVMFDGKVREALSEGQLPLMPKPSSSYCCVCHEKFADYQKHIDHPIHKKNIVSSHFEEDISQLIDLVQRNKRRCPTIDLHHLGAPIKKRKIEECRDSEDLSGGLFKEISTGNSQFFNCRASMIKQNQI